MLNRLRIRLTLLYLLVTLLFAGLVSLSAYLMIFYYFQDSNDAALSYKMALTFQSVRADLPSELNSALINWEKEHSSQLPSTSTETNNEKDDDLERDDDYASTSSYLIENYEGELSSIFILPLDLNGRILFNPNPYQPPMSPDLEAVSSALANGRDLRTGVLDDGSPVRLLTYVAPITSGYGLFQLGKPVTDQARVLRQLVGGLLIAGALSVFLLGAGSWWMAGRSLRPMQKAWEMQQTFVSNASHELRTPLTLVRASAEVAQRHTETQGEQSELLGDIIGEVDHMTRLVEDLLLLSRLDAGQLKLEKEPLNVQELLEEISRSFSHLAASREVKLVNSPAEGRVLADRTRLRQVVLIVLDNALRHSPAGNTIYLGSRLDGKQVKIEIRDSGAGIDAAHLDKLFDRFYQVDSSRSGENKGSGLGLSIAKSLIEAHEGQIKIESQPGQGTKVYFCLPVLES